MADVKRPKLVGKKIEIRTKPIEVLGKFDVAEIDDPNNFEVFIDKQRCTPELSKIILKHYRMIP